MTTEEALAIKKETIERFEEVVQKEQFLHLFKLNFETWLNDTPEQFFFIEGYGDLVQNTIETWVKEVYPQVVFSYFRHSDGRWQISVG
jgi:hypothetical protein